MRKVQQKDFERFEEREREDTVNMQKSVQLLYCSSIITVHVNVALKIRGHTFTRYTEEKNYLSLRSESSHFTEFITLSSIKNVHEVVDRIIHYCKYINYFVPYLRFSDNQKAIINNS